MAKQSTDTNTRQEILNHSLALFSTQGYHATSMRDISKAAGVSLGLAYNYFPGKGDILKTLFVQGSTAISATLLASNASSLHQLAGQAIASLQSQQHFWRLVHQTRLNAEVHQLLKDEFETLEQQLLTHISSVIYKRVKDRNEVELLSQVFYAMFFGASQQYLANSTFPMHTVMEGYLQRANLY